MNQQTQKSIACTCQERREWIINAIKASIRWYAQSKSERKEDKEHLLVLLDTMDDLMNS